MSVEKHFDRAATLLCVGLWTVILCVVSYRCSGANAATSASAPPDLTFDELVTLSQRDSIEPPLKQKLDTLLSTAVIANNPKAQKPHRPVNGAIGPVLRLAEWNIERGLEFESIEQALTSPEAFAAHAQAEDKLPPPAMQKLRDQVALLRAADVLVLNEVDIGVKRTDYRDVVKDLANSLGMHSVYSVEFLEVDPLVDLGEEPAVLDTPELSAKMTTDLKPDPARFRGMHVNAVLSRYPIRSARVIPLPVCYDWYGAEKNSISHIEKAKRAAADKVFLERIGREVRRGSRSALLVSLAVPEAPGGVFTVVNAHLENKGKVDCRRRQMGRVLEEIDNTPGPVVVAGDLNTTGTDGTPTSVRYELAKRVKDYQFWIGQLWRFTPVAVPMQVAGAFRFWRNFRDPTAKHIPVIGANPEAQMFTNLRKFEFADEGRFDFAGSPIRNRQGRGKTLSDSNERASKGFVPTFSMPRSFGGLVQYRLDWILVKPAGSGSVQHSFEPDFPVTMKELNEALPDRLSDHAPITVDLPLRAAMKLSR